jgi:gliding motility-associated-like protein
MKILATLFFLCIFVSDFFAQKWGANTFSQFTNEALDVEIDIAGNSYITGYVTGETAFNTANVIQSTAGNGDIYVAKYDQNGTLVWYKNFGGNYSDRAYDLAIGPDQNIVVTGQFFGSVTFGSTTLQSTSNSKDIFLLKLDSNGDVIWALKEGGDLAENAYGVTVDNQNNVILTGQFKGNSTIANSNFTSAIDPVNNDFSFDLFISKYDAAGNPIWVKAGYAIKDDRGLAVAVDNQDNIFLSGQYSDTLTFAGNTYNNNGYNVGFLTKISPSGQIQFFNNMRAGFVLPYDLEVNSSNEVIVTGDFLGAMFYYNNNLPSATIQNPYTNQIFVFKIGNSGNLIWNYTLGSESDVSAASVSIDPGNNIFVTGYFNCALSQLHDLEPELWNSVGFQDPYILKLSNQGNFVYAKQMGGKMNDVGHGIAIQSTDKPIICGGFTKSMNVAPTNPSGVDVGNNNYQLNSSSGEVGQFFLTGDSTRNSFLLKYVDVNYPNYNYYNVPASDSLVGNIVPNQNPIHYCRSQNLSYETLTWNEYGPSYQFSWTNGDSTNSTTVSSFTGNYNVIVNRNDGCATDTSNVNLVADPIPTFPLLSDNIGEFTNQIAVDNEHYGDYFLCQTQNIPIYFNNLANSTSLTTIEPNGNVISGAGVFNHNQEGEYAVIVDNGSCIDTAYYRVDFQFFNVYDSLDLKIKTFYSTSIISNDTITSCQNIAIFFFVYDSITNPNGSYSPIDAPYISSFYTINGQIFTEDSINVLPFNPPASGNYLIEFDLIIGYSNSCGIDTVHYHFEKNYYFRVIPNIFPSVSILGDNTICQDGSIFLTHSATPYDVVWYNPAQSLWVYYQDSLEINSPGDYYIYIPVVDTIYGVCNYWSSNNSFHVDLKQAPNILINPLDAVICPYDSAALTVPNIYQTYQWVGPDGDTLSNSNTCFGSDQGFYYCHVIDDDGCALTSPPIELIEYSTPSVTSYPQNFICDDEIITIMVNYVGSPAFQWSPIATNADEILVNQPGTYSVTIEQCGITLTQDFTIVDASLNPIITNSEPNCLVDEITIQGNIPNVNYYWSTGDTTNLSINVTEFGDYSATVINEYGCIAQTNTLNLTNFSGSFPPPMDSVIICFGSDVNFIDSSGYTLNWYDLDTNFLQTSSSLSLLNVQSDTAFLIAYSFDYCLPVYKYLLVDVVDSVDLEILGDSIFCPMETADYFINSADSVTWSIPNQILGTSNPISLNPTTLQGSEVIFVTVTNQCFSQTFTDSIQYLTPESISFAADSIIICQYDTLIISLVENVTSTTWTGSFGTITSNTLQLNEQIGNGTISASAIGLNGCYTDTISLNLTIPELDYSIVTNFSNLCDGSLATVEVFTDADSLLWTTPIGTYDTSFFSFYSSNNTVGTYNLTLWDIYSCYYDTSISIANFPLPKFELDSDTLLCLNDIYTYLFPSDTNTFTWSYYGSVNDIPVTGNQELILTATSPAGCMTADTIYLMSVNCDDALPNIITSNGDGTNDFFVIDEASIFPNNHLYLFNRWGEKIFEQEGYQNTFEGSRFSEGVYWYVFYQDPINNPKKVKQGFLHIYH